MSDFDDRKFDAQMDAYLENRDPEEVHDEMMKDLEHDIEEAIGKYPDLSDGDVIKVLEDYIGFIKKRNR